MDPGVFVTELLKRGWRDGGMAMAGLSPECSVVSGGPKGYDVAASELLDPDFSPAFRGPTWRPQARSGWFESSQ